MPTQFEEGIIEVDSAIGKSIGFTSDKFEGYSYLWHVNGSIYISAIATRIKNKGYFSQLCECIEAAGYKIKIPTPLGKMGAILRKWKFKKTIEETDLGPCEVWVRG